MDETNLSEESHSVRFLLFVDDVEGLPLNESALHLIVMADERRHRQHISNSKDLMGTRNKATSFSTSFSQGPNKLGVKINGDALNIYCCP